MIALTLLVLLAGDPNEWSTFPDGKPAPAKKGGAASPQSGATVPESAMPRYREAVSHIGAGRFQEATVLLNQLAAENPRVAEVFAARCSAQLGLRQATYAEADCAYALKLKPQLSMALYGLANAEDLLGKRDDAQKHYRDFARDPSARADLRTEAGRRADKLGGAQPVAPPPPGPEPRAEAPAPPPRSAKSECRMGSDGRQACGYNCMIGSDGVSACADTPDGRCALGSDGHVTCSQLAVRGGANAGGKPPECRLGSDGRQTCGYNCRMGSNGRFYCATTPDGQCAMNSNGTFTCP